MPDLLIRNVSPRAIAALKERAKRNRRSMQAEALAIIEDSAGVPGESFAAMIARFRAQGKLIDFDVPAALSALREDRDRDH
jgi:plasmid stability protein